MGTVVAVKKGGEVCMAADAWNLQEDLLKAALNKGHSCVLRVEDSLIGLRSSTAYQQAFEAALAAVSKPLAELSSRAEVFDFFLRMHETLRNHYYMRVVYDQVQEFEWSPMNALVVNRSGIYKVDSSRAVFEFDKFWALGSGETFALGALHALYDGEAKAEQIARGALAACAQFDRREANEIEVHKLKIPDLKVARRQPKKQSVITLKKDVKPDS